MLRGVDVGRCSYIEKRLSTWREASEMREQAQGTGSDPQSARQSPRIHVPGKNQNPDESLTKLSYEREKIDKI